MKKRIIALILSLSLVLTCFGGTAWADEDSDEAEEDPIIAEGTSGTCD